MLYIFKVKMCEIQLLYDKYFAEYKQHDKFNTSKDELVVLFDKIKCIDNSKKVGMWCYTIANIASKNDFSLLYFEEMQIKNIFINISNFVKNSQTVTNFCRAILCIINNNNKLLNDAFLNDEIKYILINISKYIKDQDSLRFWCKVIKKIFLSGEIEYLCKDLQYILIKKACYINEDIETATTFLLIIKKFCFPDRKHKSDSNCDLFCCYEIFELLNSIYKKLDRFDRFMLWYFVINLLISIYSDKHEIDILYIFNKIGKLHENNMEKFLKSDEIWLLKGSILNIFENDIKIKKLKTQNLDRFQYNLSKETYLKNMFAGNKVIGNVLIKILEFK